MKCPYCANLGDKVVDSRESKEGEVIRRRRECLGCGRRFTSYERIDEIPYMVVKKDGSRERFERQKLLAGLLKACEKRPVSVASLEAVADRVESALQDKPEREMSIEEVGAFVMNELRHLDKVAYVRFASVYRHFRDIAALVIAAATLVGAAQAIQVTPLVRDGHVYVSFQLSDAFENEEIRDAIHSGLTITFVYDVELRRGAAGWLD